MHMQSFAQIISSQKAKSLSCSLIKVNHALVINFSAANMAFSAIRESKILAKFPVSGPLSNLGFMQQLASIIKVLISRV